MKRKRSGIGATVSDWIFSVLMAGVFILFFFLLLGGLLGLSGLLRG